MTFHFHFRDRVVFPLGTRSGSAASGYTDAYHSYDYAIGGVPFYSAASRDDPLLVRSADFRKDQIDQSVEPGEQSLTGWWVRSQQSFHGGTGLEFSDPALDESAPFRFKDSEGVDVWTPGEVTLLPVTEKVKSITGNPVLVAGGRVDGTDMVLFGSGTTTGYIKADGTTANITSGTAPANPWQAIASDGDCFWLAASNGIWKVRFTDFSTYTYEKQWTYSATTVTLGWAKGRLMAGIDEALYELIPPGGGLPYALPGSAVYTSLVTDWAWSSITAGPEAIYASGYKGNRGSILKVLLDETTGALPTLTGATEVAQLPTGEWPTAIRAYLGTRMAIGTNRGVRVADVLDGGGLEYGPLIEMSEPVYDMVGVDRFVYVTDAGGDPDAGLVRIDLSLQHPNDKFAYANDLRISGMETIRSVALIGDSGRLAIGSDDSGVWFEDATDLVTEGFLLTAQARYNTLWPKLYKRLSVRANIVGTLGVTTVDRLGSEVTVASLDDASNLEPDLAINSPDSPQESLGLRFTLTQDTATTGPVFRGYQFKALPGGPRQYEYLVPLMCYDSEMDGQGGRVTRDGWALERLMAIREIASEGTVVLFQDLRGNLSELVTIEKIEFRQVAPGEVWNSTWGGVLTLSMRTLD